MEKKFYNRIKNARKVLSLDELSDEFWIKLIHKLAYPGTTSSGSSGPDKKINRKNINAFMIQSDLTSGNYRYYYFQDGEDHSKLIEWRRRYFAIYFIWIPKEFPAENEKFYRIKKVFETSDDAKVTFEEVILEPNRLSIKIVRAKFLPWGEQKNWEEEIEVPIHGEPTLKEILQNTMPSET